MLERRKAKRTKVAIPVSVRLIGIGGRHPAIKTITTDVSPLGIAMVLPVILHNGVFFVKGDRSINLIRYLVQREKGVELTIDLPSGDKIKAKGRISWYDLGTGDEKATHYLRCGIEFRETAPSQRRIWEQFTREAARGHGRSWQGIQFASAIAFAFGVIIFMIGYLTASGAVAMVGVLLSSFALITFVISWWQYRSHMLLKKDKGLRVGHITS